MAGRLTDDERADRKMTEAQLNSRVQYRAKKAGWSVLRIQRSMAGGAWRTGASRGFPDLVLVGRTILFRELKRELGHLDPDQVRWGEAILAAGGDWAIWRPSDIRLGRVVRELEWLPADMADVNLLQS